MKSIFALFACLLCLGTVARGQGDQVLVGQALKPVSPVQIWTLTSGTWSQVTSFGGGGGGGADTVLALTTVDHTTSGTVSAGARALIFGFSSDFTGSFNGLDGAKYAGGSVQIPVASGCTLPAVAYIVTTGTCTEISTR
jgi:hypothetical protein